MNASLGLGTVQFGSAYGISNETGITELEEVVKILYAAAQHHVRFLDTAPAYNSETILGNLLPEAHSFSIITKTPVFPSEEIKEDEAQFLEISFNESLQRLKQPSVYGLLVHHADDILKKGGHLLFDKMLNLKQRGKIKKLGVSVYTGREIDAVMDSFPLELIQLPVNVLDQRLLLSGHLEKLKKAGIEIHARSIFLQGLLLMEPLRLPAYFYPIRKHLAHYREKIEELGLTPLQAALGFVISLAPVDSVICGVINHKQLHEICSNFYPCDLDIFREFAIKDDVILNPSLWRL
jgi:aryl-alcohol dehydrogenase-like predicted oxidoreductase